MRILSKVLIGTTVALASAGGLRAQQVEYFWDTDPGIGKGLVLQQFTGSSAQISVSLDAATLSAGVHQLGLRTIGRDGKWSATYYRSFYVPAAHEDISRIEYFWDKEVAPGKGQPLSFTAGQTIDLTANLSAKELKAGMHTLYLRSLSDRHSSNTYARLFYVPPTPHKVKAVEYWIDNDPGVGRATRMTASLTADALSMAFDVNTDGLADGVHQLGLRTLTDGTWSEMKVRRFLVRSQVDDYITRLEYFWNNDPGAGNGYAVGISPGREVTLDFEADMTMLGPGPHTLGLRAQSGSQGWSPATFTEGIAFEGWDNLQEYLDSFEDTHDVLAGSTYQRQFKNLDWHALYVPFALSYNDWSAHFDVARINAFYQYDDDEDGEVDRQVLEAIIVRPGNGSLKPNHPYLIRAKQKGTYTFSVDASLRVAEEINSVSCSTLEAKYTFTGNYSDMANLKSAYKYRLRGSALSIPETDEEVLPPYRWYLTIDHLGNQLQSSAARVGLRIVGEGDATGIESTENGAPAMVYDLQGRRIGNAQMTKGLYIINNKKHIIR